MDKNKTNNKHTQEPFLLHVHATNVQNYIFQKKTRHFAFLLHAHAPTFNTISSRKSPIILPIINLNNQGEYLLPYRKAE